MLSQLVVRQAWQWHGSRIATATLLAWNLLAVAGAAKPPSEDPSAYSLKLPTKMAPIIPGDGARVLVRFDEQSPEVCNMLGTLPDRYLAVRPAGTLACVAQSEATLTDRPFHPITHEALAESTAARFKGFKTHRTKRFVYVYNTSDLFYVGSSRILETMYPALYAYWQRLGVDVHEPETPLLVIMFRTYDEYSRFRPMEENVTAYYCPVMNYVVMYEVSPETQRNPLVYQRRAVGVVAHEGTHQILANIGVQGRLARWPLWIQEGLSEYFGSTELGANVRWKGVGSINDFRMGELEFYIEDNANRIAAGETIRNTVTKTDFTSTDYAIAWAMVHFLAQRRQPAFFGYLKDVCQMEPLERMSSDRSEALFVKHFGDDYAALENALVKHLKTLPYKNPYERSNSKSKSSSRSKR